MKAMIHHDQAGFIPGRSIFDHIRLTRVVITYAETLEVNGAIITLDQEKAYDKTQLPVEDPRGLQAPAILIKSLYQNAQTTVAINRELSVPNSVKCRVRQGDPLSCFLFNIGIEPLACMI